MQQEEILRGRMTMKMATKDNAPERQKRKQNKKRELLQWNCTSCGCLNMGGDEKCVICTYERLCQSRTLKALKIHAKECKLRGASAKTKTTLIKALVEHKKEMETRNRATDLRQEKEKEDEEDYGGREEEPNKQSLIQQALELRQQLENLKKQNEEDEKKRIYEEEEKISLINKKKDEDMKRILNEIEKKCREEIIGKKRNGRKANKRTDRFTKTTRRNISKN